MNKLTTKEKREIRGIVYAVEYQDKDGKLLTPDNQTVEDWWRAEGWDVQSTKLGTDGYFLVEVRL